MDYFSHDLIVSVFERLPVKSLIRFKSLSKEYGCIIFDSNFKKNHLKIVKSRNDSEDYILRMLFMEPEFMLLRIPCDLNCREESFKALETTQPRRGDFRPDQQWFAQCDGMLCTRDMPTRKLLVWNPATKVHMTYSSPPKPTHLCHLGFGYVSVIDDYMVVNIFPRFRESHQPVIHTMRLKTGLWNVALNEVHCDFDLGFRASKTVDECVYWIGKKKYPSKAVGLIVSFDLEKERLREIIFPYSEALDTTRCVLGILRGSLCLTTFNSETNHYDVWIMDTRTKCWENLFKFPTYSKPSFMCTFSIFYLKNGQILTNEVNKEGYGTGDKDGQIRLYNLKDETVDVKKIGVEMIGWFAMQPYVESLVSP